MGVNRPKKIIPITIGLIIIPSKKPNFIQSLLSGLRKVALKRVTRRKTKHKPRKMKLKLVAPSIQKYKPHTKNKAVKKYPNLLLDGSLTFFMSIIFNYLNLIIKLPYRNSNKWSQCAAMLLSKILNYLVVEISNAPEFSNTIKNNVTK